MRSDTVATTTAYQDRAIYLARAGFNWRSPAETSGSADPPTGAPFAQSSCHVPDSLPRSQMRYALRGQKGAVRDIG